MLAAKWSLGTFLGLMELDAGALDKIKAVNTFHLYELTFLLLFLLCWARVEMVIQLAQLSHPLAALVFVGTVHLEFVECSF